MSADAIVAGFIGGAAREGADYLKREHVAALQKEAEDHRQAFLKAHQERGFAHDTSMQAGRQRFQSEEADKGRKHQTSEREAGQEFQAGQKKLDRDMSVKLAQLHEAGADRRNAASIAAGDRRASAALAFDKEKWGVESKRAAQLLEAQLKTQGLEQGVANLKLYAAEAEQRLRAQYQTQIESGDVRGAEVTKRTLEVMTGKAKDKFVVTPYEVVDPNSLQKVAVGLFVTDTTNGAVKFQSLGDVGVPGKAGPSGNDPLGIRGGDKAHAQGAPASKPSGGIVEGAQSAGGKPSADEYKDVLTKLNGSQLIYGNSKNDARETALQWIHGGKLSPKQVQELEAAMGGGERPVQHASGKIVTQ